MTSKFQSSKVSIHCYYILYVQYLYVYNLLNKLNYCTYYITICISARVIIRRDRHTALLKRTHRNADNCNLYNIVVKPCIVTKKLNQT